MRGIFQQWEDFHFTKENHQNFGCHTTQNFCRSLFKQLEILPVPCQYILSLMNFIINNQEFLQTNSSMNNINTKIKHHLHKPNANLSCFQKSTFYAGIKIFTAVCHLVWQSPRMTRQNWKQPYKNTYICTAFTL